MDHVPEYESEFVEKIYEPEFVDDVLIGKDTTEHWKRSLARAVMKLHDGVNRKDADRNPLPDTNTPPQRIICNRDNSHTLCFSYKRMLADSLSR